MMRLLLLAYLWTVPIAASLFCGWYFEIGWWSVLIFLFGAVGMEYLYKKTLYWQPDFLNYPAYRLWKQSLLSKELHPLIDLPLHTFVALNLDSIYRKKGLWAAEQAVQDQLDKIGEGAINFVDAVANRRLAQLEAQKRKTDTTD